jgi:serine/threonine protein kinase/formylglycine-generating enzyme required for sulfatase activity
LCTRLAREEPDDAPVPSFADYARGLAVLESYRQRQRAGAAESAEEFVAAHADLADVLRPMLDVDAGGATLGEPAQPWRGLPEPGDVFGSYRIEALLGQGGMGIVFTAHDVRLPRKVALKLIRPERLGSPAARERFWREAKLAARLEHKNICPVYEVGEVQGAPFMAMRFLDGDTLAARLAAASAAQTQTPRAALELERRRIDEVLAVLETVARALHFAHEHGVVHRDVKPANILIEPDGNPIVLDFGMARAADDDLGLTMTGELAGTPYYMAPEQVTPSVRGVDHRADVYALGVTIYEAVTLTRPFGGQSMRELLDAIAKDSAPPPSRHNKSAPTDLDVVLGKALDKDVDRRYRTAAELADDLARVRARQPVRARRASRWLRLRRFVQRNPLASAFFAVTAIALVVISLLFVGLRSTQLDYRYVAFAPRLDELQRDAEAAYEKWPDHHADLAEWLARAQTVCADVQAVRDIVARLDATQGSAAVDPVRDLVHVTLRNVVKRCDALLAAGGPIARAKLGLAWADQARAQQTEHAPAWAAAAAAIAQHPRYGGLALAPQFGLVPLEPDPHTGLWEFWHPRSGARPQRDAHGAWDIGDDTGIVFVLLPGGTFTMGAQRADPQGPNYDPMAVTDQETPLHPITLPPFFLAKHELTQGQWMRLAGGANPADARPGSDFRVPLTLAHPVEMVSWAQCGDLLARDGLVLPTEAQWEYACRGGGAFTPWWTGTSAASLSQRENVADKSAADGGATWDLMLDRSVIDGFVWHAPVDALAPNGFGLFHMAGNVQEWCRDRRLRYDSKAPIAAADGLRGRLQGPGDRVVRGGSFGSTPRWARTTHRVQSDPSAVSGQLGVRAARSVR